MAQLPAIRQNPGGRTAARYEHPLERLGRDFDSLFDRLLGGTGLSSRGADFPLRVWDFDVRETDKEVVVRAELPGFEENELDVQINQDVLTIRAEKEQRDDRHEEYQTFFRAITLPPGVDGEKASASFRNGVLELHVPRAIGAQPKRIAIQAGDGTTTNQEGSQSEDASAKAGKGRSANGQGGSTAAGQSSTSSQSGQGGQQARATK